MPRIQKWVIFTLIAIIIIAVVLRLIKLYEFAIWGSDSGEYYYLMSQYINSGQIDVEYNGWGFAYPYFPGMFLLTSGFAQISGLSTFQVLLFLIPTIAALSVLLIFCIAYRVFRDPRVGLVAAGFVAVLLPHVYASSHPMPGSLGGFFFLLCIFLLLKTYDNYKFILPLAISTILLVFTHHLTTYFLIISLVAIILTRELLQYPADKRRTRIELTYLIFLITITLPYWIYFAVPFGERILARGLPFSAGYVIILAYFTIGMLWIFLSIRRKFKWKYKPKHHNTKSLMLRIILFQIVGVVVIGILSITEVPGTNMQTHFIALPLFIPTIIFISFMSIAPAICQFYKDGFTIIAWMGAIVASVVFAFITKSQELLLYRHFPYMFEPVTILAGLGLVKIYDMIIANKDTRLMQNERGSNNELIKLDLFGLDKSTLAKTDSNKKRNKKKSKNSSDVDNSVFEIEDVNALSDQTRPCGSWRQRITAAVLVSTLIVICGIFSYPPLEVVSGFEEGTTIEEFDSCLWAEEHLGDDSTVASDHRMSSMLFGFAKINSSWEFTPNILHGESLSDYQKELMDAKVPAGKKQINYVLITKAIKEGVALEQWENARPMSEKAIEKFDSYPFIKLYDNGETQFYCIYETVI